MSFLANTLAQVPAQALLNPLTQSFLYGMTGVMTLTAARKALGAIFDRKDGERVKFVPGGLTPEELGSDPGKYPRLNRGQQAGQYIFRALGDLAIAETAHVTALTGVEIAQNPAALAIVDNAYAPAAAGVLDQTSEGMGYLTNTPKPIESLVPAEPNGYREVAVSESGAVVPSRPSAMAQAKAVGGVALRTGVVVSSLLALDYGINQLRGVADPSYDPKAVPSTAERFAGYVVSAAAVWTIESGIRNAKSIGNKFASAGHALTQCSSSLYNRVTRRAAVLPHMDEEVNQMFDDKEPKKSGFCPSFGSSRR